MFKLLYTSQARKDYEKAKNSPLEGKLRKLLTLIETNPFQNPPPFERLRDNLSGAISRRLNKQHRLVYQVLENVDGKDSSGKPCDGVVKVLRVWTHYE
jgi:Txe/YoeB family toxin of toxin-antitoxin system